MNTENSGQQGGTDGGATQEQQTANATSPATDAQSGRTSTSAPTASTPTTGTPTTTGQTTGTSSGTSTTSAPTGGAQVSGVVTGEDGKPLVKTDVPQGETQSIPTELQSSFPSGAIVTKHESGQLVASLPTDGGYHRVVVPAGQSISNLARAVESHTQSQQSK
jgi:hypothetical protein